MYKIKLKSFIINKSFGRSEFKHKKTWYIKQNFLWLKAFDKTLVTVSNLICSFKKFKIKNLQKIISLN